MAIVHVFSWLVFMRIIHVIMFNSFILPPFFRQRISPFSLPLHFCIYFIASFPLPVICFFPPPPFLRSRPRVYITLHVGHLPVFILFVYLNDKLSCYTPFNYTRSRKRPFAYHIQPILVQLLAPPSNRFLKSEENIHVYNLINSNVGFLQLQIF